MTTRTTARTVGALFIVASATAIAGGSMVQTVEDGTPAEIADQQGLIVTGFLFEVLLVAAVVGIAVLLYPVLRRRDEGLALAYVGARIIEATLLLIAALGALLVLAEATGSAAAGPLESFTTLREWSYLVGSLLALGIGAVILYWLLFASRLVPTWISLWGLAGAVLVIVRAVLELYGVDLGTALQGALTAPIGLNEMVLAIWLIVRGFDEHRLAAPGTRSDPVLEPAGTAR